MKIENIEKFFLNTLLIISMAGVCLILVSNLLFYPEDTLSISIAFILLIACSIAYILRNNYPTAGVIIVCSVALLTMGYQRFIEPSTTTPLSVILIVGFIISTLLKNRSMWIMHTIAVIILTTVFIYNIPDKITAAITYSTLYIILSYATQVLKSNYDRINKNIIEINLELKEKAAKIANQNQELLKIQDNLNALNKNLERIVNERTAKIQLQNEMLIKYSYSNAHHLRGPVARLLGLAAVYKIESEANPEFYIEKMVDQAHEIDSVVKKINTELQINNGE